MNLEELVILLLGAVGWTLVLVNKLPKWAYQGEFFLARMLRCELCTGTEVGWVVFTSWGAISGLEISPRNLLNLVLFGPMCGVVALVLQKHLLLSVSLTRASDRTSR